MKTEQTTKCKRGRIIRMAYISRDYVRAHRDTVFVFGDNMIGRGLGGQAGAMRGEPNTVGIPTKRRPERGDSAYFYNDDWSDPDVRHAIFRAFDRIEKALADGKDVVIPTDGLGTGLAELPQRAPKIHAYIEGRINLLSGERANA